MFEPDKGSRLQHSGALIYDRRRPLQPGDRWMAEVTKASQDPKKLASALDTPQATQMHGVLMGHYLRELDRQSTNRLEMAMDEDFYDGIQFTEEELAILAERGQAPLVFNLIATTVNWVLGTQRRSPADYRILARKKDGVPAAERKTQLMKHVSDGNRSEFEWSQAFASAVKAGLGWMESGQGDIEDGTKVMERSENWRFMLWDSTAHRYDLQDARYIFRSKWLDLDIAMGLWWSRAGILESAAQQSVLGAAEMDDLGDDPMDHQEVEHQDSLGGRGRYDFNASRDRVRVIECWFKRMVPDTVVMQGGQFHGENFDEWSPGHWAEIKNGLATISVRPRQQTYVALMTETGLLDLRPTPYRHNKYPFTPVWGNRRARDGMPYGLIRNIRDPQRDFNKRASKALHHLSTARVLAAKGSFDDVEEVRAEAARPDAVLLYDAQKGVPQIQSDTNIASGHIELMQNDASLIQSIGGVTDENLGRTTNARSGIAIERRQSQGQLATSIFFENLRQSRAIHGEKQLVLVEQYYTDADEIRVTDSRGNPKFHPINDGSPENAIADNKADYIVSEDDWRATVRQAQADQLMELAGKLAPVAPEMVVGMMDLLVEAMDVPKKDELVKRIRNFTGMEDPDADPDNPTPEMLEKQAQQQAKAQMEQRGQEAELANREAEAAEKQARAAKANAEADKIIAEAEMAKLALQERAAAVQMAGQGMPDPAALMAQLDQVQQAAAQQAQAYEQQIADLTAQAEQARIASDVELQKAQIAAQTEAAKAQAAAQAQIRVAEIEAQAQAQIAQLQQQFEQAMQGMSQRIESISGAGEDEAPEMPEADETSAPESED